MNLNVNIMSCITDDLIQKYIDDETNLKESVLIKNHLASCDLCFRRVKAQQKMVREIKNTLNLLTQDKIEVPPMPISIQKNRRRPIFRMSWAYVLIAASVLVFIVIFSPSKEGIGGNDVSILQAFDEEFDANLPVSDQQMIINVVDPTGKVTEFYVN